MSDIAIHVEDLGKQYRIGALQKNGCPYTYKSLRDSIGGAASAPFRAARALMGRNGAREKPQDETIWALKDVSFDVKHGEIVGVIGRNGAGKSTLLKVLSRITEPTTGRAEIHGRVGSLLEVGTGFHPELTGRDNVYLNGAILGMKHAEIARQFDAIVAFAEVEKFIDTPVKHYSTGMYLRLAFAVAAHLQTEILMVDEVLAVGDSSFQKKCLGKMGEVGRSGKTIIFISHNLDAIASLCGVAHYLDKGNLISSGEVNTVIRRYVADIDTSLARTGGVWHKPSREPGIQTVFVEQDGIVTDRIVCGHEFTIVIEVELTTECNNHEVGFGFIDEDGRDILCVNNKHLHQEVAWPRQGRKVVKIKVPFLNWIGGDHVYLGAYFGWIGGRYEEFSQVLKLNLLKKFESGTCDRIVERRNKVYIDGAEFI